MVKAGALPLYIERGTTPVIQITVKVKATGAAVDFTGATFKAQIREFPQSTAVLAEFATAIVGDPTAGTLKLSLTQEQTGALPVPDSTSPVRTTKRYCYDVLMTKGAQVERILEGVVEVSPEVTRA